MTNDDILRDIRKDNSTYLELKSLEECMTNQCTFNQEDFEQPITEDELAFLRECVIYVKNHREG